MHWQTSYQEAQIKIQGVFYFYGACPVYEKGDNARFVEAIVASAKKYKPYVHEFIKNHECLGEAAEEIAYHGWFSNLHAQEENKQTILGEYLHNFIAHDLGFKKPTYQEKNLYKAVRELFDYCADY